MQEQAFKNIARLAFMHFKHQQDIWQGKLTSSLNQKQSRNSINPFDIS